MRAGKQSLAGAAMIVAPALALVGLAGPAAASSGRAMPLAVAAGQPDSTTIKVGGHPTAIAADGQAGLVRVDGRPTRSPWPMTRPTAPYGRPTARPGPGSDVSQNLVIKVS